MRGSSARVALMSSSMFNKKVALASTAANTSSSDDSAARDQCIPTAPLETYSQIPGATMIVAIAARAAHPTRRIRGVNSRASMPVRPLVVGGRLWAVDAMRSATTAAHTKIDDDVTSSEASSKR